MSILEKTSQERCFYCADGSVLCSVYELEKKLHAISEQAYGHHARQDNNDFSNWIRDVFLDYELAEEIKNAGSPKEAAAIVKKHLSRAAQSKNEIESAIRKALNAKAAPAMRTAHKKSLKARRKPKPARRKNRKVNKKGNKLKITIHRSRAASKSARKRGSVSRRKNSRTRRRVKKTFKRQFRKQVNQWIKWLKIVPELS